VRVLRLKAGWGGASLPPDICVAPRGIGRRQKNALKPHSEGKNLCGPFFPLAATRPQHRVLIDGTFFRTTRGEGGSQSMQREWAAARNRNLNLKLPKPSCYT
jgi:hypothetical protein